MFYISFLVDDVPIHYYQAELLLFSLEKFAGYNKSQIVIHCTNRVKKEFLKFLEKNEHRYCLVEPYLDKKYCNKIRQLDFFLDKTCDGIFLLDTDMFVLEPLSTPNIKLFSAKIVDSPNPPLDVIEKIFAQAQVELPHIVSTDLLAENAKTVATNFNGGFYYIPQHYIATVRQQWRKWAQWLFDRQNLFPIKQQANHIDQVSMALCLAEKKIPYAFLAANANFPVQTKVRPNSYCYKKNIMVLHYHNFIEPYGYIYLPYSAIDIVRSAIKRTNKAITNKKEHNFFKLQNQPMWKRFLRMLIKIIREKLL